ncbi:MAG TPA: hypothetical protein DEP23_14380 [Ruminococcaceae bacterium]|nr:hypothetical protein [Oscillospiraceae bacterium]
MKNNKKIIALLSALAVVVTVSAILVLKPKLKVDAEQLSSYATKAVPPVYVNDNIDWQDDIALVGEAGGYQLYYDRANVSFSIKSVQSGHMWKSGVTAEEFTPKRESDYIWADLQKACIVGYTNFADMNGTINIAERLTQMVTVTATEKKLKNGVAVALMFEEYELGFTMELWLDEDGLNVRIPRERIVESGEYGITNITVFPMLGATTDSEDGYIVYPDGPGALYRLISSENRQSSVSTDVYFPRTFDLDSIERDHVQGKQYAMLPVYGVTTGSKGLLAYILEGEMNSYITLTPSGNVYDLHRIQSTITYRKAYQYVSPDGTPLDAVEKNISAGDYRVHYFFMEQDTVTYSSMAQRLREYMLKTGRLSTSQAADDERVNVNLQMIMGSQVKTMVATTYQEMTTFDDIQKMVGELGDPTGNALRIMMLGWQKSGYNSNPTGYKPSEKIGGLSGLKRLTKSLGRRGIDSYLIMNMVDADAETRGFTKQSDAAYKEMQLPITNADGSRYLTNGFRSLNQLIYKVLPYFNRHHLQGIGFDKLGKYVYDDYQTNMAMNRSDMLLTYRGILQESRESGRSIAVQHGNAYALERADYLYDVPLSNSNLMVMSESVPFYQMVVHGIIPYSGVTPGNMSVDYAVEKLKWIEYGCEPMFLLTQNSPELFKGSKVTNAFATKAETLLDEIASVCQEFNKKLRFTANHTISEHKKLSDGVYRVSYANGWSIYINYNRTAQTIDGIAIGGVDYTVIDNNGNIVE